MTRGEEAIDAAEVCRFAGLLLQVIYQVGLGRFQRWSEAEEQRRSEAEEERGAKDERVRFNRNGDREAHRTEERRERFEQELVAPETDQQSRDPARDREEQAFAKQLPDDAPAGRAECDADGHF